MNPEQEYQAHLFESGRNATIALITGDECPCMTSRDDDTYGYSQRWHDDNPDAEDCNGTGLISDSTTNYSIKGIFSNELDTVSTYISVYQNKPIGEYINRFLVMFGAVLASNGSEFDISSLTRRNCILTFNSKDYKFYHYLPNKDLVDIAIWQEKE